MRNCQNREIRGRKKLINLKQKRKVSDRKCAGRKRNSGVKTVFNTKRFNHRARSGTTLWSVTFAADNSRSIDASCGRHWGITLSCRRLPVWFTTCNRGTTIILFNCYYFYGQNILHDVFLRVRTKIILTN